MKDKEDAMNITTVKRNAMTGVIETTIGDLISAICDAAEEARIEEGDVARVTHMILSELLETRVHVN